MAYDPKLWIDIRRRYWEGESLGEIAKSLKASLKKAPSRRAIEKRALRENWDRQKSQEVAKHEQQSSQKFADFLQNQDERYERILRHFDATYQDINTFGNPAPGCSVKEIIAVHKDWRELRGIIDLRDKPKAEAEKQILKQQEAIKNPELKKLFEQAESIQNQIDAICDEMKL